jgi:hypothetical protein
MMFGADSDQLESLASVFDGASKTLDTSQRGVRSSLMNSPWSGVDANSFRMSWDAQLKPQLASVASALASVAELLRENARQQSTASASGSWSVAPSDMICQQEQFGKIVPRTFANFESRGSGRADIVEAFYGTGDIRRAENDEIEIRKLDNGRYIVVLPGVVDLTRGKLGEVGVNALRLHAAGPWFEGEQPNTVRRMEYAIAESQDSSDTFANPYAARVMEQMERAGIPPGADVMLVGHSFGAYTAMELAGNDKFNSADGTSSGYHVNVTHVVAAGADTNWKLPKLPDATNALILNNRRDPAFVLEDPLVGDASPHNSGQVQMEFNGRLGHSPDNYAAWLSDARDRPELNSWLDAAGGKYSAGGTSFSVKVPDYK